MTYTCPKCRCGCMFEEKGKLICLNCGAASTKLAAEGVRHTHVYETYQSSDSDQPRTVPQQPRTEAVFRKPTAQTRRDAAQNTRKTLPILLTLIFALIPLLTVIFENAEVKTPEPIPETRVVERVCFVIDGDPEDVPEELRLRMEKFVAARSGDPRELDLLTLMEELKEEVGMSEWDGSFNFSLEGDSAVIAFRPD